MSYLRSFLRVGYAPLLLIGVNGVALGLVAWDMPTSLLLSLLSAVVVLSFAAERISPYQPNWNRSHGDAFRDTCHAFVNETANFATLLLLPALTGIVSTRGLWPASWPFALQVVFAVLLLDAGVTFAHYASHRIGLLWRFHAVHHSVRRMYGFNGLMKHPIHQAIETFAGTLPLLLLGLPANVATVLLFAVAVQLLLQHSNVDYTVGPFKHLLATSEVHRFHHQKSAELGDVNFGLFTTIWDRALGTFRYEDRRRFTSGELGIGAEPDYPVTYLAQLLAPFRSGAGAGASSASS